ncbi:major facilitator superfamily domain-containing protein [Cladorrhinum sp. PSN259]|nr:major facilitator superfamily domain-containing protein [Cladorrhinum sp. PSN259]
MSTTTTTARTAPRSPPGDGVVSSSFDFQVEEGPSPRPGSNENSQSSLDAALIFKLVTAAFSFFVAGVNDGSIGALIPHIIRDYGITTAIVSALYATSFAGWLFAALTNTHASQRLDTGAMLVLGAVLQILSQALRCWPTPPFWLFILSFFLTTSGQGFQDTHANGFVAQQKGVGGVHRWLGAIHAAYMAGCFIAPFVASSIASAGVGGGRSKWYLFYNVPLGFGILNLGMVVIAFRDSIGWVKRRIGAEASAWEGVDQPKSAGMQLKETLTTRSVWLISLFFFFYIGVSITAGGWVVEYLVDVRNGQLPQMGYVSAGFSGGCLLGRILLPEPIHRWGERRMVFIFCVLALAFQLVFWLVPNIIAASIAISFLGFFIGPFFSTGISVGAKLFPSDIRSTAISFVFVFAQTGGSLFPIIAGILGSRVGVTALQPMLVALIAATAVSWLLVPKVPEQKQE